MKISGCLIVKNEEANISKCISNLKMVTDEIIVVDTGSSDNTIKYAEEAGAKVLSFEWENDFSAAKNFALEHTNGDWIIFLDADEYFDEISLKKIKPLIVKMNNDKNIEGILCRIINIDLDSQKIISSNQILRIFRNGIKYRFINKIHEEIRKAGIPLKCINVFDEIILYHTGYSSSMQESKAHRNLDLLLENNQDEKFSYYIAITYFILKDYDNACKYAKQALSIPEIHNQDSLAYKLYIILIKTGMILYSNSREIELLINEAKDKYRNHPEIIKIEATYLFSIKRYSTALEKYNESIKMQAEFGNTFEQNDFPGTIDNVFLDLGKISYMMNKNKDALNYYVEALKSNKFNANAFVNLIAILRDTKEEEVIYFINSLYDITDESNLRFIIPNVVNLGKQRMVLFYVNKWNDSFKHEDDSLIFAFIAMHDYKKALEIALLYLNNNPSFLVITVIILILGELYQEIDLLENRLKKEYIELVKCYLVGNEYTYDNKFYVSVLMELIKYAPEDTIDRYLNLVQNIDKESQFRIAEIFLQSFKFNKAIACFQKALKISDDKSLIANANFNIGYCYYKQMQYSESLVWFEEAVKNKYKDNDIVEFLNWISEKNEDKEWSTRIENIIELYNLNQLEKSIKLNIVCGRDIKDGWINLDSRKLPGVDVIADLDNCRNVRLPLEDNFVDEILASHVIEHINDSLAMMEELHRISKPNAKAVFKCSYGTSDDAFENPTHVKQYFLNSFGYFSQPFYWRADYGYKGDWCVERIILVVDRVRYGKRKQDEVMEDILKYRNVVKELIVELRAVKPIRPPQNELHIEPKIEIMYV